MQKRSTKREFGRQLRDMRKNPKLRLLLDRPIEVSQLPPFVPRGIASAFSLLSTRTLMRYEGKGLTPIRRGRQSVCYERGEFLKGLEIKDTPGSAPRYTAAARGTPASQR